MPTRLTLSKPVTRAFYSTDLFFCSSCSLWRISSASPPSRSTQRHQQPQQHPFRQQRTFARSSRASINASVRTPSTANDHATSLSSRTAINAPIDVPAHHRPLYDALDKLKSTASNYVNLSRLQLALRGLERGDTVVRIAVLGMSGYGGLKRARKLVRLLLADPLIKRAWEEKIDGVEGGEEDGRGLLIRLFPIFETRLYGEETEVPAYNPLIETLPIPSQLLQRHNIEILVSSGNVKMSGPGRPADAEEAKEALVVPSLQTPISSTGRSGFVTYPVHYALLVGEGVESAVAWGRYDETLALSTNGSSSQERTSESEQGVLRVTFDIPSVAVGLQKQDLSQEPKAPEPIVVDIDKGAEALSKFQESTANASAYEHGWLQSNVGTLEDWIKLCAPVADVSETVSQKKLHPALGTLIKSILNDSNTRLNLVEATQLRSLLSSGLSEEKRAALTAHLSAWSESAHRELQISLERAFISKEWRKLRWYKLFWRVDDVQAMATNVISQHWLPIAQDESYIIIGRMIEAGLLDNNDDLPKLPSFDSTIEAKSTTTNDSDNALDAFALNLHAIDQTRAHLLNSLTPALQTAAQSALLSCLGTVSLTSALSALTYVWSLPPAALDPATALAMPGFFTGTWAGAILSGGLVFALARLQRRWERAMAEWEAQVREEGRRAIKSVEEGARWRIREGGKAEEAEEDGAEVEERKEAREGLDRCWERLAELEN
ncbi:MAG: hypothetical protein M1822_007056 [Bathelium mastoideum]|nr:MAG: hypothetical protein M1822_007056 [Bathelium mastoideum]